MSDFAYVGSELDLFAAATNWKGYLHDRIAPHLGPEVLEVGAGFGGTTRTFCRGEFKRWVGLEPDPALAARMAASIASEDLPGCCTIEVGTLDQIPEAPGFDTLLYIDVLEHIEDDAAELTRAAKRLKPGGRLVVLSPAHQQLFSPFDRAIGHFRRYSRRSLAAVGPPGLDRIVLDYLDSVGLFASLGNRLVLNQSMPNPRQINAWDKLMVPLSRRLDPLLGRRLGKSVLGVWRKPG